MILSRILLKPFYKIYEKSLCRQLDRENLPQHIGIILDGNRRFARSINIPMEKGYLRGQQKLEDVLEWLWDLGVKVVSVWVFSTENFTRDLEQVSTIMRIAEESTIKIREDDKVHSRGVKIRYSGDKKALPDSLQAQIRETEKKTEQYENHILNVCLAYGGREEMTTAVKRIAKLVKENKLDIEEITESIIDQNLYTNGLPDPDLIIRTSGSVRLSGFLMWQSIYSELFFTDVMWPALRRVDLLRAIRSFQGRKRNYGK